MRQRRGWIQGHTRLDAFVFDALNRAMQMRAGLDMDRQICGTCLGKFRQETVRVGHHQMDIEGKGSHLPDRFDDRRADGKVRHEMPVHDIHVHEIGASPFDGGNLIREMGEVGRQDRRGDANAGHGILHGKKPL